MPKNGHHKMDKERTMKHIKQPFVFATGIAALIHSTWSLGTFFAGTQPEGWHLLGWLVPALLIAFALDIGQIVTSTEIREHGLTVARGITFMIFALATYYLQWLYIAHHMPALPLSEGISPDMQSIAIRLRDMALWIIPSLMPLSTLLYTFSSDKRIPSKGEPEPLATPYVSPSQDSEFFITLPSEPLPMLDEPLFYNGVEEEASVFFATEKPVFAGVGNSKKTKHCEHCNKSFQSRSVKARFCSDSCRVSAHKASKVATLVSEDAR
jgi:hypothetical protein